MIKVEGGKEGKEPCPGLVSGKTTVIAIRGRRVDDCHPFLKDKGRRMKLENGSHRLRHLRHFGDMADS